jgi:hypothetical protein
MHLFSYRQGVVSPNIYQLKAQRIQLTWARCLPAEQYVVSKTVQLDGFLISVKSLPRAKSAYCIGLRNLLIKEIISSVMDFQSVGRGPLGFARVLKKFLKHNCIQAYCRYRKVVKIFRVLLPPFSLIVTCNNVHKCTTHD